MQLNSHTAILNDYIQPKLHHQVR